MTPLSQRDNRWGNIALGFSNTKIRDFGCTITCIAMLVGTTPDVVNRELKRVNGFAQGNLVIWSKIPEAFPSLTFVKRSKVYDNNDVKVNLPCLVEVDFDNSPNSFGNHWVIFLGNQRLVDPWVGQNRPTSAYKILKGYTILKKKDNIEPAEQAPPIGSPSPQPIAETPVPTPGSPIDEETASNTDNIPQSVSQSSSDSISTSNNGSSEQLQSGDISSDSNGTDTNTIVLSPVDIPPVKKTNPFEIIFLVLLDWFRKFKR